MASGVIMKKMLMRENDLEELTGIPVQTLRFWRFSGPEYAPNFIKIGKNVFYVRDEIDEWIKNQPRYKKTPFAIFSSANAKDGG